MSRHDQPPAVPGPRRRRAQPPQGRAAPPEPVAVVLARPRRGVHVVAARRRPHPGRVRPAVRARGGRGRRLRPGRRGRPVGPRQPAGLGDLRVGAARDELACLPAGLVRADGGPGAPTSAAGCCRDWEIDVMSAERVRVRRRRPRRARQRARPTTWRRRGHRVLGLEQFELGHERGASHDTSRILRHSYHTPGYVALTFDAYDDWATLEDDSGEQLVTQVGGLDLFPPDAVDPDRRLHGLAGGLRTSTSRRSTAPAIAASAGRSSRCRTAPSGCTRSAARSCRPRAARPRCRRRRARFGADLRDRSPVDRHSEPTTAGVEVVTADDDVRAGRRRRVRRRVDQPGARPDSTVGCR